MKQIKYQPSINFNFSIIDTDIFFIKNDQFIIKNNAFNEIHYFDLSGNKHRLDGPSNNYYDINPHRQYFHINHFQYNEEDFAEKTNHLICNKCYKFCKQSCF